MGIQGQTPAKNFGYPIPPLSLAQLTVASRLQDIVHLDYFH